MINRSSYKTKLNQTYKSREVVVDALCSEPLAQFSLFAQELCLGFLQPLGGGLLVVAGNCGLCWLLKLQLAAQKQLLMYLLWWYHVACPKTRAKSALSK